MSNDDKTPTTPPTPPRPNPDYRTRSDRWREQAARLGPFNVTECDDGITLQYVDRDDVQEHELWAIQEDTGARQLLTKQPGRNRYCVCFQGRDYLVVTEDAEG